MTHVDFTDWVTPDLVLTLGGRTFTVSPPSVDQAGQILALTVRAEITLGIVRGDLPAEMQATIEALGDQPLGTVSLGDAYDEMAAAVDDRTLNRMAMYALFYWSRGKARADAVAKALWTPKPEDAGAGDGEGKAPRRSRSTSGPSTASGSRTPTASTPTTGSLPS